MSQSDDASYGEITLPGVAKYQPGVLRVEFEYPGDDYAFSRQLDENLKEIIALTDSFR